MKLLEMQSCRFGCRVECVQETFRRVGVTVEALLGVYNNLVQANVSHRCQQGYVSVTTLSCQLVLCVCVHAWVCAWVCVCMCVRVHVWSVGCPDGMVKHFAWTLSMNHSHSVIQTMLYHPKQRTKVTTVPCLKGPQPINSQHCI